MQMIAVAGTEESQKRAEDSKREKYGDTDMLPPSLFLKEWDSVNPNDYPYPMPTRERQNANNSLDQPIKPSASIGRTETKVPTNNQPQLNSQQPREVAKAPVPAGASQHSRIASKDLPTIAPGALEAQTPSLTQAEPSQNIIQANLPLGNQQNPKRDPKPSNIFIQKNKIPNEATTAAAEANTPLFKPPSPPNAAELGSGMDEDDPCIPVEILGQLLSTVLPIGAAPRRHRNRILQKRKKTNHLRIESGDEGSPGPLLEESRLEELNKPLKLDRNLLKIIVCSVIVKIKVRIVQFEYDKVTDTIEDELKSSIEDSVLTHSQILTFITINPSGLFTDNWRLKPVEYVEKNIVPSSNHGEDTRVAQQEDIQFDSFFEKRSQPVETAKNVEKGHPWAGGWGDDTTNQTINPVSDTAPVPTTEECPWGNDEPTEPITSSRNEAKI
ncbi:hypothetical protein MJO28_008512 [Puccinia striiformis f. sp. tritici]|uniref:Uncharacterized protein n=1 Tax=Puccinia striiformis f. sp. tritici TaxID=168172 RepID=A0ACC0ECE4_9BASI|nr:hypothetical protein MJO28_008512 [Puccinia striiformis f. sp. tritici]